MRRNIVILGSTGSIGENALRVASHLGDEITVVGIAAGRNVARLAEQAIEHRCRWASIAERELVPGLARRLGSRCQAIHGEELCERVAAPDVDIVLCAIVGTAGLRPVLAAIRAGKDIALASKEVLVMAGELVMGEAKRCGVRILPVDSEHCALFQCLDGRQPAEIARLLLTASGGAFLRTPAGALVTVTPEQALAHPTWNMGRKVTIDSATLMNKGLEIIEACRLFEVPPERIDVVVHPQSIVHSMVEFVDGSTLAQLSHPDMRLPIQYCLTYPERRPTTIRRMDFAAAMHLDFEPPDHERFPALRLAKEALRQGGTMTAVFNAANEVAVDAFCEGRLSFPGITATVAAVMEKHGRVAMPDLEAIIEADRWARRAARKSCR